MVLNSAPQTPISNAQPSGDLLERNIDMLNLQFTREEVLILRSAIIYYYDEEVNGLKGYPNADKNPLLAELAIWNKLSHVILESDFELRKSLLDDA